MKAIVLSIRPEGAAKILSGKKRLEPRKTLPKELPCRVLLYCAESDDYLLNFDPLQNKEAEWAVYPKEFVEETNSHRAILSGTNTGKIVAEFTLSKADRDARGKCDFFTGFNSEDPETGRCEAIYDSVNSDVLKAACVSENDYKAYACKGRGNLYLWHIEALEIFDKPKDLADYGLKRAPIDWCYAKEEQR